MTRLSPEARALFDAEREASNAADAGVPDEARQRMHRRVLAAAAAGSATTAAAAAEAATATTAARATEAAATAKAAAGAKTAVVATSTLSAGKAALGFIATASLTFGTLAVWKHQTRPDPAPPTVLATSTPREGLPTDRVETSDRTRGPRSEPHASAEPPSSPVPEAVAPPRTPAREDSASPDRSEEDLSEEDLSEQAALLMQVREAIRQGRHADAQRLLDTHRRRYGQGPLDEEREGLTVLALCDAGAPDAARAAQAFVTRYPQSPLVRRIRQICPK